jgi:DNA-binding beta-propeller fold protein YncE
LRAIAAFGVGLVLLSGGAAIVILRGEHHKGCSGRSCATTAATVILPTGPTQDVRTDSAPSFGFESPTGVAVTGGLIWVTNATGGTVTEFGWRTNKTAVVHKKYNLFEPGAMTAGHNHLWIANYGRDAITEISSTKSGRFIRSLTGSPLSGPDSLVLYGSRLWVANFTGNSVAEYSAVTGKRMRTFTRDGLNRPAALAVSGGDIWVANAGNGTVTALSARTGKLVTIVRSGGAGPTADELEGMSEVANHTTLWVGNAAANTITEISTATARVQKVLTGREYGLSGVAAMTLVGGELWVVNRAGNSVTEIDTVTNRVVSFLGGPKYGFSAPAGITSYRGRIWVTNSGNATVTELTPQAIAQAASASASAAVSPSPSGSPSPSASTTP